MKRRNRSVRLKRFQESSAALKVASIEGTILSFERVMLDLSEQIEAEEHRTRIADPAHFAYSTLAKAARLRRNNLATTSGDLKAKLEVAKSEHAVVLAELRNAEAHVRETSADRKIVSTTALQTNDVLPSRIANP
jgi:flagellar FliJ protein